MKNQTISLFFIALLLFIAFQVLHILSPFFQPLFWSALLAFSFYPLFRKLTDSERKNKTLWAAVITILIFLIFVPLFAFIISNLVIEMAHLSVSVMNAIESGRLSEWLLEIRALPFFQRLEALAPRAFLKDQSGDWISRFMVSLANSSAQQTGSITKNLFMGPFYLFLTFFMVFFFLRDGSRLYKFIHDITPLENKDKDEIFNRISQTFAAVLRGQILTGAVQAVLAGIIFWALNLPLPAFFAGLTFLASLIPVFGASFVWVPFVFYLLFQKAFIEAGILFLLGTLVISLVDNMLKPVLIGKKAKLPYLLLFLGILGGLQIYGFVGVFLAPAVLSVFFVLIKIYQEKYLD